MDCYTSDVHYIHSRAKEKSQMESLMQPAQVVIIYAGIHPFAIYAPTSLVRSSECAEERLQGVFYSTWPALCNQLNAVYVPAAGRSELSLPQMGLKRRERTPYLICDTLHLLCVSFFAIVSQRGRVMGFIRRYQSK
jgi:hypothetical protein